MLTRLASRARPQRSGVFLASRLPSLQIRQSTLVGTEIRRSETKRNYNLHEYQTMALMQKHGVPVPRHMVAESVNAAEKACASVGSTDVYIKAQVLAGGRGKGHFIKHPDTSGVMLCQSSLEVGALANRMLGDRLVTKQTGEEGKPCNTVMIAERFYLRREAYFAIIMDRAYGGPVMVASPMGGMNIEDVARDHPEKIFSVPIDIDAGPDPLQVEQQATAMGFPKALHADVVKSINGLWDLFKNTDCTLLEVNPLVETHDGRVLVVDAKANFDDNAIFRNKEIYALRDPRQEDPREVEADEVGLNYIGLDGNIGCLVNGAGLAMATMDAIKLAGGLPANFLDLGGGATTSQVEAAFKLLNDDKNVASILVNIFGGIMKCDVIAMGLINAVMTLGVAKPLIVRLAGTNVNEAKQLIEESGLRMVVAEDLGDAAQKAVRVAEIQKLAQEMSLKVSFDLPLT